MRTGFPGEHPAVFSPCPTGLDYTSFFPAKQGDSAPLRRFFAVLHTQPFCMGRTVDFSCRMLYDKNGFARTQSRIIESCPRMLCGGYRKGRKTARCQPERNGVGNPTRTALWAQECTEAALAAGTKVRHWGQSPEKVGCKRGAIGSTARGRRIARRRTKARRAFSSLCAGESMRRW